MNTYKHLFFDMDQTIAPARQCMLPEMYDLLTSLPQDVVVVSGSSIEQMPHQLGNLPSFRLGQNGNHAIDIDGVELWRVPLEDNHRTEILDHISEVIEILDHELNHEWNPIEDRGAQITFSPIGNTAPLELKKTYDPDRSKRLSLLEKIPFASEDLIVKIGGSTSLDYLHKDRHKGTNVQKLIDFMKWNKDECVYFGDGLYPGGNDEAVIGVIDTIAVDDHLDCYKKLQTLFLQNLRCNKKIDSDT
ncbi:MAG: HAD-IIB family hydrolase [Candidatus Pacebacteria bacterium]|nr:HAD-IIB family hydrolase [Candidatus Paceibacterota bacterium]